jgi:hypothetical protein
MAARRLLIVMLILLGLSTLAAALVPPQSLREGTTATTTTEGTETQPTETAPAGQLLNSVVVVKAKLVETISVGVGDQVSLLVCSQRPDQVEIPALGLIQPVSPQAPARFDLIFDSRDTYGVRLVDADRVVARIEVSPAAPGAGSGPEGRRLSREQRRCAALAGGTVG